MAKKRVRAHSDPRHKKVLVWPTDLGGHTRGVSGYVIDWDNPIEHKWCAGQENVLEDAPDDADPSPLRNKKAEKLYGKARPVEKAPGSKTVRQTVKDNAGKAKPSSPPKFPSLDEVS